MTPELIPQAMVPAALLPVGLQGDGGEHPGTSVSSASCHTDVQSITRTHED